MCDTCNEPLDNGCDCPPGKNAFTKTTSNFIMPAEAGSVTIAVSNVDSYSGTFATPGQIIYIAGAGHFQVSASSSASITATNLKNTSTGAYASNVAPTTVINSNARVSPAGLQGIQGLPGSSNALIDVDYTTYSNTSGTLTLQKQVDLGTGLYLQNVGDSVEFEFTGYNTDTTSGADYSRFKVEITDGTGPGTFNPYRIFIFTEVYLQNEGINFKVLFTKTASTTISANVKCSIGQFGTSTVNVTIPYVNEQTYEMQVTPNNTFDFTNNLLINLYTNTDNATYPAKVIFSKTTKLNII